MECDGGELEGYVECWAAKGGDVDDMRGWRPVAWKSLREYYSLFEMLRDCAFDVVLLWSILSWG